MINNIRDVRSLNVFLNRSAFGDINDKMKSPTFVKHCTEQIHYSVSVGSTD